MASLVTEALASAGKLAKDDWNTKISKLYGRLYDLKREVSENIIQSYVEFMPLLSTSDQLSMKLGDIKVDAETLQDSLDALVNTQLNESRDEFRQLSTKHMKVTELVDVLENLYKVQQALESDLTAIETSNFTVAALSIEEACSLLDSMSTNVLVETNIYQALKLELIVRKETLLYHLNEDWRKLVAWSKDDDDGVKLQLSLDEVNPTLISGMTLCKVLSAKIFKLGESCYESFIKPLLTSDVRLVVDEVGVSAVCFLESSHTDHAEAARAIGGVDFNLKAVNVRHAFEKVLQVLRFLNDNLLHVKQSNEASKDETLMQIFGSAVRDDTLKLLVDSCLEASVPDTREELAKYDEVVNIVREFETTLFDLHFLDSETGSLMSYVSNIHAHFANRRVTSVLQRARQVIEGDLLDTVEVKEEEEIGEMERDMMSILAQIVKDDQFAVSSYQHADDGPSLTKYRISKSVKEIMHIVGELMTEAEESAPECAARLYVTTREIFTLFVELAPTHEKTLSTVAQASAIFHNNCWYISKRLQTLGNEYSKRLNLGGEKVTYLDQIPIIRELGVKWLLAQMKTQRNDIFSCLEPLKLLATDPNIEKYQTSERCIKQILLQLHHLRKVWVQVLPHRALRKCLAMLIDSALAEFCTCICSIEDISSSDAMQLQMACILFQEKIPYMFILGSKQSKESDLTWQRDMKRWQRLKELTFVLEANLKDIVDRWSEGKGPLADNFTLVEVKNLIRALFQNTTHRADAISKIRY